MGHHPTDRDRRLAGSSTPIPAVRLTMIDWLKST
jgi:hypothetical protein